MTARRRVLCLLAAAASLAAVVQPAPPPPVFAAHDTAANPGAVWVAGEARPTGVVALQHLELRRHNQGAHGHFDCGGPCTADTLAESNITLPAANPGH